ncbi:MAG: hypothetical protein U9Q89_05345 [Thermodesulfobacteriota bacterium]|nr:hypothetical protein [Thermodesulfobacteriota bacterium]
MDQSLTVIPEFEIQCQLSEWLTLQHPRVIFRMDLSGVRLPIGLAVKIKRLNPYRGFPDIQVFEPRGKYHGLCIELKRTRDDLYTKQGKYRQTRHIREQVEMLRTLRQKGYSADFAVGFSGAQQLINNYLDRRNT